MVTHNSVSLCLVPWVLIDGPDQIYGCNLRRVGREIAVGS